MANLNLDEILALFENGERRYAEDPIFKSVADSLKMGLGVYAVLDHTLKDLANCRLTHRATSESYKELMDSYDRLVQDLDYANDKIQQLEMGENL